ncbi:MAG: biosynthetic-type acetolactate synthase large subunit [Oscillospiraceae bacterium]|nr:biosynthetic-type acetolactate synthase large subunit [Oscillospiraceae bacterium]
MTGASVMVQCLEQEGVSIAFGYPGATICPFYDELAKSSIRHILVRQEQNAGHAAGAWGRMTGKPGVCIATSGPGATNLLTALATAYMDSVPLVAITGQVSSELLGRDAFQEADITGAAVSFLKHSFLVKDAEDLPRVIREAFYIAGTGRRGPVLIDVPIDVQNTRLKGRFHYPEEVSIRGYSPTLRGNPLQIRRVVEAMDGAQRPVICAGGGVFGSGARQEVRLLAERCGIPVACTMMGLGALPTGHPLNLGMLGSQGGALANEAVRRSDLLIIAGARAGDRAVTQPGILEKSTRVVHIDIDPAEIRKNVEAGIPLVGDLAQVLEQILAQGPRAHDRGWFEALGLPQDDSAGYGESREGFVNPRRLVRLISSHMEPDGIYVADVGQNQIWSARNCLIREGRFLTSGGMGTMGYSIPAAMGAALACPGRQVAAVCGDGAFQMQMMELATLVQHQVPVKIFVVRNGSLGLVREIQSTCYGGNLSAVDLSGSPDFVALAAAYGIGGARLCSDEAVSAAVERAFAEPGPFLTECVVSPEEGTVQCGAEKEEQR